ncbi:MAG: hypothetical protein RLZZ597_1224 [Cyanobacteriota bacterium]
MRAVMGRQGESGNGMAMKQSWKQTLNQSLSGRPLLMGGLGVSASLWLLESTHSDLFDGSTLLSALALGSGLWWWRHRQPNPPVPPKPVAPPVVDRARVVAQLEALRTLIDTLEEEAALGPEPAALTPHPQARMAAYEAQRQALATALDRTHLRGVVMGDRRSGKTTLLRHLTAMSLTSVTWTEAIPLALATAASVPGAVIPVGLSASESASESTSAHAPFLPADQAPDVFNADVVLWVTEGDLTASALNQVRARVIAGQGGVVAFNKTDLYTPTDRQTVLDQLQRQGENLPGPVAVVAVAAAPRPMTVRRHQSDGSVTEFQEPVSPQMADLNAAVAALVPQASALVAATTLRQAEALRLCIQQDLNQVRRQRAMPIIDQLQWVAGAAAFANPVPTLDVLATLAINGQLILDLGKLYGFTLSLEEAKATATTLAGLTVKLGLVELSTQALTAVLKSHFATYLAGGTVQGLSAAYLTRMAGLSLVDYFEQAALAGTPRSALAWDTIAQRLQTVMQHNRQMPLLQNLVKQGLSILKPTPALLTASAQRPITLSPTDTLEAAAIPQPGPSIMDRP